MKQMSGFTLIEMVTVVVLLGILAVGTTSFISLSTQIYVDSSVRQEVISGARFALERLTREIQGALPNSAKVISNTTDGTCLVFLPINNSVIYQDIPISPTTARKTLDVTTFDTNSLANQGFVVVYPNITDAIYISASSEQINANKVLSLDNSVTVTKSSGFANNVFRLTLSNDHSFTTGSPTKRLFIVGNTVKYCLKENAQGQTELLRNNILMAENLDKATSNFVVNDASLARNAIVLVKLAFSANGDSIVFDNEVHIQNVP